jgi:hypothetical protein
MRGRLQRQATGTTPMHTRRLRPGVKHELMKIVDAPEQKGRAKKQNQGTCAAHSAERILVKASAALMDSDDDDYPVIPGGRTTRTQWWCRACGVAMCPDCFFKLRIHGPTGKLEIPGVMGLFSRPHTSGRTGRRYASTGMYNLKMELYRWMVG